MNCNEISNIEVVPQRVLMPPTPEHRGVRLDVEIKESRNEGDTFSEYSIYDVEPFLRDTKILPKHNRFYQARIDSRHMHSGDEKFEHLPDLYVITITREDPFGMNQMAYTMRTKCEEIPDLEYKDGLTYYYFNTTGTEGGNAAIKALLDYLGNSSKDNVTNDSIKELDHYVDQVKMMPEVRDAFMKFEDVLYWERKEGKAEGIAQGIAQGMADGETRMAVLINRLILDKRSDEIQAAVTDEKVRHRLFEEYGL